MAIIRTHSVFKYCVQGWGKDSYVEITGFDNSTPSPIIPAYINDIPVKSISSYAFHKSTITSIQLPDTLEKIEYCAFSFSNNLKSISFPDSVQDIEREVCAGCDNLQEVKWSESADYIPPSAFHLCKNLTKITNIDSVKHIGSYAFYKTGIQSFKIPENIEKISKGAFSNCYNLGLVKMTSLPFIYNDVFLNSSNVCINYGRSTDVKNWAKERNISLLEKDKLNTFLDDISENIKDKENEGER